MGYAIISNYYLKGSGANSHIFKAKKLNQKGDSIKETLDLLSNIFGKNISSDTFISVDIQVNSKSECSTEKIEYTKIDNLVKSKFYISGLKKEDIEIVFYFKNEKINNKKCCVFYTEKETDIRVLAAFIGRKICGNCAAKLYGDIIKNYK